MNHHLILKVAAGVFIGMLAVQAVNYLAARFLVTPYSAAFSEDRGKTPAPKHAAVDLPPRPAPPVEHIQTPPEAAPAEFAPAVSPPTLSNCYGRDPQRCSVTKSPK